MNFDENRRPRGVKEVILISNTLTQETFHETE
jgi:hypothetical protein